MWKLSADFWFFWIRCFGEDRTKKILSEDRGSGYTMERTWRRKQVILNYFSISKVKLQQISWFCMQDKCPVGEEKKHRSSDRWWELIHPHLTAFKAGLHLVKTEAKVHFLYKRRTLNSLKPFSMICSFDLCMALSILC